MSYRDLMYQNGYHLMAGDGVELNSGDNPAIKIHKQDVTLLPKCGQIHYDGHYIFDICGGLRTYMKGNLMTINGSTTITDIANPLIPNPEVSFTDKYSGSKILPIGSIIANRVLHIYFRGSLGTRNNKEAFLRVYVGNSVLSTSLIYSSNTSSTYFDADISLTVYSIINGTATINACGRTLFGTGVSGSTGAMRYIIGTLTVDTTIDNTVDVTYQLGDASRNVLNTVTIYAGGIDIIH